MGKIEDDGVRVETIHSPLLPAGIATLVFTNVLNWREIHVPGMVNRALTSPKTNRIKMARSVKNIIISCLLLGIVLFCSNYATSFPIQDARIIPEGKKQIAIGGNFLLVQEDFSGQKKPIVDSAVSKIYRQFIDGCPITSSFSFGMNKRYELGFGPLGAFQKYGIIVPSSYDRFALSSVAVTQTFNIGFALYPNRFYGMESNGGILVGIPLIGSISLTTGVLAKLCLSELLHSAGDTLMDSLTCWQYGLVADLEQIVIPVNIIMDFPACFERSNRFRMSLGAQFPFDVRKTFTLERDFADQESENEVVSYSKKCNVKLMLSVGYIF